MADDSLVAHIGCVVVEIDISAIAAEELVSKYVLIDGGQSRIKILRDIVDCESEYAFFALLAIDIHELKVCKVEH
jgi:hypothetical protein